MPNKFDLSSAVSASVDNSVAEVKQPENTGAKKFFSNLPVEDIRLDPKDEFTKVFNFDSNHVDTIAAEMDRNGYDRTQPLILLRIREEPDTMDAPFLGDGAHRLAAAKKIGLEEVPVYTWTFDTRKDALIYIYKLQLNRRNLTPDEKYRCVEILKKLKTGRNADGQGRKAAEIARETGMSVRSTQRMMNVIDNADEETVSQMKKGEISLSKADRVTNEKKKGGADSLKPKQKKKDSGQQALLVFVLARLAQGFSVQDILLNQEIKDVLAGRKASFNVTPDDVAKIESAYEITITGINDDEGAS